MPTCLFTLTTSESKRLLGRAVAHMASVQQALRHGHLIIAGGTTNAYVLEELTGQTIDKGNYTAGLISQGVPCVTDLKTRQAPAVFVQGERVELPWNEVIRDFTADDVLIKGANAFDLTGNAGILLGGSNGGTIGQAIGYMAASGAHLIMPIGMEKLVPDVIAASAVMGQSKIDQHYGMACGLFVVNTGQIITEVEALDAMFAVDATVVAAGGVGDSEGAITLAVQGDADKLSEVMQLVKELKKEPRLTAQKRSCVECSAPCDH